jgi:hypothetical protein
MSHPDGAPFSPGETTAIHARLRQPAPRSLGVESGDAWIFHLGQPVAIGSRTALRVCASAPLVSDICERIIAGDNIEYAFAGWVKNIDLLFTNWLQIMADASAKRDAASVQHGLERAL